MLRTLWEEGEDRGETPASEVRSRDLMPWRQLLKWQAAEWPGEGSVAGGTETVQVASGLACEPCGVRGLGKEDRIFWSQSGRQGQRGELTGVVNLGARCLRPEKVRTLWCGEEYRITGSFPGVPMQQGLSQS